MYKFTNGIVVFDTETRDRYIKAGMTLIEEKGKKNAEDKDKNIELEGLGEVESKTRQQSMAGRVQEVNTKNSKKKL